MTQSDHFFIFKKIKISKMPLINTVLALAAFFACYLFWWATALHGIGIRSDSVTYLWMARSFSQGLGLGITDALGQFKPVIQGPPFYPLLLSFCLWISSIINPKIDAEQIARLLGILLNGATIWIFGRLVVKISNRSIMFVALAVAVLLSSPIFWDTYLYATPEPLFIVISLSAIYLFLDYLRTFLPQTLFWSGLLVGLSVLTGYTGLYLIPVMGISVLILTRRSLKRNIFALGQIVGLGLLPILFWEIRNYSITGSFARWQPVFTPISTLEWDMLRVSFANWFSPFIAIFKILPLGLSVLLAFSTLIISLVIYYRRRVYGNNESQEMWWKILLLCILSYLFTMFSLKLFFSSSIPLEEAHVFFPAYTGLLLLVISILSNAKEIRYIVFGKYTVYAAFGVIHIFAILFLVLNIQITQANLVNSHDQGLALNSTQFKNSQFSLALKGLKATNPLYFSDNTQEFYWVSDKTPSSNLNDIDENIVRLSKQPFVKHDIVIVLMDKTWVNVDVIKYYPSAQKIYKGDDGVIFLVGNIPAN